MTGGLRMKRLILTLVSILLLTFTGCVHEINMTQEDSDAIAEYMAGLLLANSNGYNKTLIPMDVEVDKVDSKIDKQPTGGKNNQNNNATDGKTTDGKKDENDFQQLSSLNDLMKQKNFDISYSGYKLTEFYPENSDKTYISVEAEQGQQLLIVKFTIKNKEKKAKSINLSESAIKYQLELGSNKIDKPWFTVLENDMQYIDMKIDGEASTEAILIYQISKDADTKNMKLVISKDKKEIIIPVK